MNTTPNPAPEAAGEDTEQETFTITRNKTGESHTYPANNNGSGDLVIDVGPMRPKQHFKTEADPGHVTVFPGNGLASAATVKSAITFIDGEKGILRHRGYKIEDLVKGSYLETAFLLNRGKLPNRAELEAFEQKLVANFDLPDHVIEFIENSPQDSNPMSVMTAAVAMLDENEEDTELLIAKVPAIMAMVSRHVQGKDVFVEVDPNKSFMENITTMLLSDDEYNCDLDPTIVEALDKFFILHADHEQNLSTTTVRAVRSGRGPMHTSISAGMAALSTPLHGGANVKVLNMLNEIQEMTAGGAMSEEDAIAEVIERAKDKSNDYRLMGVGHAVYKNFDPRAEAFKSYVAAALDSMDVQDPRLKIARKLEETILQDEYFTKRGLYPNVDFYSGILLSALKFDTSTFTTFFGASRTSGWHAHAVESDQDPTRRIYRPRQEHEGPAEELTYVPIDQRIGANGGPALDEHANENNGGMA